MDAAASLWEEIKTELQLQLPRATFDTWIKDTKAVHFDGKTLIIAVPNPFALDWLSNSLQAVISRTASRIAKAPVTLRFQAMTQTKPSDNGREPEPRPGEIAVELVEFDPTKRGWVQASNYAIRFWQPYLGPLPFALWLTLRSFAFHADRDTWPSIQTLADICANGNRHRILGRATRKGRAAQTGALQVLENERIVWVKRFGSGPTTSYRFRVLESLPLLTPQQVRKLPRTLQEAHDRFVRQCSIDYEEWEQLTLPTLAEAMSRT